MRRSNHTRYAVKLSMLALLMFGFGFALVPLYELICRVAGINSISSNSVKAVDELVTTVDTSREITVQFDATVPEALSWDFKPSVKQMVVHPGQRYSTTYVAVNHGQQGMTVQAVPGVTPWQASEHFNKVICFCFEQQYLKPNEQAEMTLQFIVSPSLPSDLHTVTLSYSVLRVGKVVQSSVIQMARHDRGS